MVSLQLEQAAEKHSTHKTSPVGSILYIHKTTAFKAGAEWRKERYKKLLQLVQTAAQTCEDAGNVLLAAELTREIETITSE